MRPKINIRIRFANIETECLSSATIGCLHFGIGSNPARISWIDYRWLTGPTTTTAIWRFRLPAVCGCRAYPVSCPAAGILGGNRDFLMRSLIGIGLLLMLPEGACIIFRGRTTSQGAPGVKGLHHGVRMAWQCLRRGLVVVGILIVIILPLIVRVTRVGGLVYVRSFIVLEGSSIKGERRRRPVIADCCF